MTKTPDLYEIKEEISRIAAELCVFGSVISSADGDDELIRTGVTYSLENISERLLTAAAAIPAA